MTTVEMIESLPSGWSMWHAATGLVCVQIRNGGRVETFSAETLSDAVTKAHQFKPIPRLRRCPEPFIAADWVAAKFDGRWSPKQLSTGRVVEYRLATKKECEAAIVRAEKRTTEDIAGWHRLFAERFPNGATEGVDYVFESA